jgi:hypothetical protein
LQPFILGAVAVKKIPEKRCAWGAYAPHAHLFSGSFYPGLKDTKIFKLFAGYLSVNTGLIYWLRKPEKLLVGLKFQPLSEESTRMLKNTQKMVCGGCVRTPHTPFFELFLLKAVQLLFFQ